MSIDNQYFESADEAFKFLADLAESDTGYLFRGHSKSEYRLCTTLSRFTSPPHESWSPQIDLIIQNFRAGLVKLGLNPIDTNNRLDWMEYARHHGVPTPCIDFSYSPYVALFFAFNCVRKKYPKPVKPEYSVVYVLDINQIGAIWAEKAQVVGSKTNDFGSIYQRFRFPKVELFEDGFPSEVLQLIPYPGKYNNRMQRQFGALVYDTLNYSNLGVSDFEELIEKAKYPDKALPGKKSPPLIKVYINQQCVSEVFTKLELMGVTGGTLYMDTSGVALDVMNSYNHNPKIQYLRGVSFFHSR